MDKNYKRRESPLVLAARVSTAVTKLANNAMLGSKLYSKCASLVAGLNASCRDYATAD